jgi:hypothetical protein
MSAIVPITRNGPATPSKLATQEDIEDWEHWVRGGGGSC